MMRHLELFSGIGGFRQAIDLVCRDNGILSTCVGFSEIDHKAHKTYCVNFNTENDIDMGDIVAFTSDVNNIMRLPDFDILTGGFPCQTFSMMGEQAGFQEERGQMFFRIMDIIKVKRPKYILLENVKNILNHDKGNTIRTILEELHGGGYSVHLDIFNTNDFGLPQTRNRTLIFARHNVRNDFVFSSELVKQSFNEINKKRCSLQFYDSTIDILEEEVDSKYYLSERIKPTILSDGSAGFKSNSEIDKIIARPLTASMHKMHRACQDNYFSDLFIQSHGKLRPSSWMTKEELAKLPIRKLTPEESFKLQGFPAEYASNSRQNGVADGSLYKQAGNAVSVNTIYAVLHYLLTNKIIAV